MGKLNFKSGFRKLWGWFAVVFVLLFIIRLIYGYTITDISTGNDYSDDFFNSIDNVRKNYASEKIKMQGDIQLQSNVVSNQKFEKTANIRTKSSEFEKDEKLIKTKIRNFNAIIQYEQNLGQKGNRQMHLMIGVNPLLFDSFYVEFQKIGVLKAIEVTKVDKTNEYKQLNARKISIEKTLQSLTELKSKSGQISDFVMLNDKIMEIEEKLQELGVELGNFDAENEFCTVKLSLYESANAKKISLFHRILVALEWTIKYYALIVLIFLCISLTIVIILTVVEKLKILNLINNKPKE